MHQVCIQSCLYSLKYWWIWNVNDFPIALCNNSETLIQLNETDSFCSVGDLDTRHKECTLLCNHLAAFTQGEIKEETITQTCYLQQMLPHDAWCLVSWMDGWVDASIYLSIWFKVYYMHIMEICFSVQWNVLLFAMHVKLYRVYV